MNTNNFLSLQPSQQAALLSVSLAIASIRDKVDLLKTINDQLTPLFATDATGLFIINEAENYHYDLTVRHPEIDNSAPNEKLSENWSAARILHRGSAIAVTYDELKKSDSPIVFDFADLFSNYPHPFAEVILNAGYRETMGALLRVWGEPFGILFFNSRQKGFFSGKDFPLFQAVADQVAVAVSNILANEAILEREREKTALLAISKAIATIRDKKDLLEVIIDKIKPLFDFNDCGLFVFDAERQHLEDLTVSLPTISPSEANQLLADSDSAIFPYPGSVFEPFFERLRAAGGPLIHDYQADKLPNWETYVQAPILDQVGYAESMFCLLKTGGEEIGAFAINSLQKGHFCPDQFRLFQAISDQLSVAVANILANEDILEREREKTLLLSLSEAIATVRSKEDILGLIVQKVKPLFKFYDCGILIIDKTNRYHDMAVIYPTIDESDANYSLKGQGFYQNEGLAFRGSGVEWLTNQIEAAKSSIAFDYMADNSSFSDHLLLKELRNLGYKQAVAGTLKTGGKVFGCFTINYIEPGKAQQVQIPLFQNVVDQLSVAVANILANEEILEREREKSLQLAVTTALTSQLAWTDKFQRVAEEIGQFVPWDMANFIFPDRPALSMRWRKADDGSLEFISYEQKCRELQTTPLELRALFDAIKPLYGQPTIYAGEAFQRLRQQYPLVELTYQHWHIRSRLDLPIRVQGAIQVMLVLTSQHVQGYTETHLALLRRLVAPMALALENIFSFEKLEQREAEKTRQLALNQVLVGIKNSGPLYAAIARELNQVVHFGGMNIRVVRERHLHCYALIKVDGEFVDSTEQVRTAWAGVDVDELELGKAVAYPKQATIYTGNTFDERCAHQPMYRLCRDEFGVRSSLEIRLPMKDTQLAILMLHSETPFAFTESDLTLLLQLIPPVALAIENQLAFDEIKTLKKRLEQEKTYLVEEIKTTHNFEEIIGTSPLLGQVFRQVSQVAPTDTTVLLTGESGTGKELIARALHNRSPRKGNVLVKINCAALPASLIESELFGHEKGAFTGAIDKRIGKFELANRGTLFLDEIGELPVELQSKLLRVLQEKEYERLGSNKLHKADVRIIAATNRDLEKEVAEGRFRLDLFYRLSVFPLHLPALRDRREDIPLLANYFGQKFCRQMGKPFRGITADALDELLGYGWPGNIRELENVVEQAVIINAPNAPLSWGRPLTRSQPGPRPEPLSTTLSASSSGETVAQTIITIKEAKLSLERDQLMTVLRQTGGRIRGEGGAAEVLNIKPTTLESRLSRLGIKREHIEPA